MRVLLVEDCRDEVFLIEERVRAAAHEDLEIVLADTLAQARAQLHAGEPFDIALVDLCLPDSEGIDTVEAICADADVPIIVLTGLDDEAAALAAVNAGAQDYLVKGSFEPSTLRRSIRYAIERHRLEQERRRLSAELGHAQKMEAIGQLAGGIAHDFNNMLTVIIGHAQAIQRSVDDAGPIARSLAAISTASERAAALTAQLLAFGRVKVASAKPIDLNACLAEVATLVERVVGEDVDIIVKPAPNLWTCVADPSQITQVIVNLAVNARDAMQTGGVLSLKTENVRLSTSEARGRSAGEYVRLVVADTGHGMDEATVPRIFEPFFTTKPVGKGTGLGLASVYAIVDSLGGFIDVASVVGEGTRFSIFLPRSERSRAEASERQEPATQQERAVVLVVDDEQLIRELIVAMLEGSGYEVIAAADGLEAIAVAERYPRPIAAVVTDVVMPRMSGRELVERLCESRPGLEVLFMSGHTSDAVLCRGVAREEFRFLQKPFPPHELVELVHEMLGQREPAQAADLRGQDDRGRRQLRAVEPARGQVDSKLPR
ncbi:MAG: response regulator [Nannocystaceae bacterium]